ncbi:DUF262 domain-containing protein [Glutamicibacter mysorens]|uniref:DUF262 domain-containing protein n=1 Tax=Glutamicibacter mysorens TaxID=257984 RepID=UPI0020C6F0DB|nr:DUF262 domain-containing protein [Glutamicibacter mysorens]UTM47420.1 DUF262 domain-containing protein [Glutamicibacter mysorens]
MTHDQDPNDLFDLEEWFDEQEEDANPTNPGIPVDPAEKYARSQLRVVRETKDYQLDYLQHALKPGRELIDISPAYQRRLRWTTKKKSLLIESFLLNIPVPPIFLFERDYNEYEVIDGRQRLDAISSFLSNEYSLTGLEYWPELNRRRFLDLPKTIQRGLLRRSLAAVVLLAETQAVVEDGDIDVRRVLFDRLNTGGIRLNPQELRNALYPGAFNAMLIRVARSSEFTKTWGIPPYSAGEEQDPPEGLLKNKLFASLADAELVLRFFALRDAVSEDKRGSLRSLLDKYMAQSVNFTPGEVDGLENLYLTTLNALISIFGENAFKLSANGRLSRPLYDALMIAFAKKYISKNNLNSEYIKSALHEALENDEKYDILVGRGNTISAVHERVQLADQILAEGLR